MNKFTRDVQTLVFSKKWLLRIPSGAELTQEVLEHFQKSLNELDEGRQSAIVVPTGWELVAK